MLRIGVKKKQLLIMFSILLIILILKYPTLNKPVFWDDLFWMKSAEWISEHNFNPIMPIPFEQGGLDTGHPPLSLLILAVTFSLFGKSLVAAHLVMVIFVFLTLYFTYLLGSYLYNERVGLIATALLLFSALFFAQSGTINMDKALAAFTVMTIYFALRNKPKYYVITGSLLVLSKEAGVLTILAVLIYVFIKNYHTNKISLIKNCCLYALPLVVFFGWVFYHHTLVQTGSTIGSPLYWNSVSFIIFFRFFSRVKFLFFDNYHWVLTLIILISLVSLKRITRPFNIRRFIFSVLIGIFVLFVFHYGFKILLTKIDLLTYFFSLNKAAFWISKKNLEGILLNFYSYRFIFALFTFVLIFVRNNISFQKFKDKELIPVLLTILFYLILFSWTLNLPRYYLPVYPLFFILSAYSLNRTFKKKAYFVCLVLIILLITQWSFHSNEPKGYLLDENMGYMDVVKTHKAMADYIEKYFFNSTILTLPWMTEELRYPILGYVKNSISPLDYTHYDSKNNYKTIFVLQEDDWYYYNCYLKKQCDADQFIPNGEGDVRNYDNRYNEYLTLNSFDIFYYSPQDTYSTKPNKIINDFNLTLIKRFEINNKYTELYASPNFKELI